MQVLHTNMVCVTALGVGCPGTTTWGDKTYSAYKNHYTFKFLISITPQGTVSFISKAWGESYSDIHITEKSGYLDKLLHCDIVFWPRISHLGVRWYLGCRSFDPWLYKGEVTIIPNMYQVEQRRKIAWIHIHVERVIGAIRKSTQY